MNDISLYEKIPALENSFPVKIESNSIDKDVPLRPHWHEHTELLFFTHGTCRVGCNENTFTVSAGDLVVVNRNHLHYFTALTKVGYYYVIIYPPFFEDVDFKNIFLQEFIQGDAFVKECIEQMYSEHLNPQLGSDINIKGLTYRLISHLIRNYNTMRISDKEYSSHLQKLERLNTVLTYISEHYQEKISVAHLAKMCYLTESHFCRFFKNAVGQSAVSYINEIRIEKAAVLLKNTDESIAEIGEHAGFDDANYFTRIFKKLKGVTPGQFRREQ